MHQSRAPPGSWDSKKVQLARKFTWWSIQPSPPSHSLGSESDAMNIHTLLPQASYHVTNNFGKKQGKTTQLLQEVSHGSCSLCILRRKPTRSTLFIHFELTSHQKRAGVGSEWLCYKRTSTVTGGQHCYKNFILCPSVLDPGSNPSWSQDCWVLISKHEPPSSSDTSGFSALPLICGVRQAVHSARSCARLLL